MSYKALNTNTDEYYTPILRDLAGPMQKRAMVDPVIAPHLFSMSDSGCRVNDTRPLYISHFAHQPFPVPDEQVYAPTTLVDDYAQLQRAEEPEFYKYHTYTPAERSPDSDPDFLVQSREPVEHYGSADHYPMHEGYQYYAPIPNDVSPEQLENFPRPENEFNIDQGISVVSNNRDLPIWGYGISGPIPTHDQPSVDTTPICINPRTNPESVYDARAGGFGDERRRYIDPVMGNPRWNYDDVDAARIPQYVQRSYVDMVPRLNETWYAPETNSLNDIKHYADDHWRESTGQARLEVQERLTRKYNNKIGWQRRQMPVRRLF